MNATVATLANEAARLLPEPPAGHDAFGYLAWEELVVGTARRLSELGGSTSGVAPDFSSQVVTLMPHTRRLDAAALLSLATLVADEADPGAGERALWLAVTRGDDRGQAQRSVLRSGRASSVPSPANRRATRRRRTLLSVKN